MPELPDIELYLAAFRPRVVGRKLRRVRIANPFLLRSVEPPLDTVEGCEVTDLSRLGKRVVFHLEGEFALVIHLMIAGRFQWKPLASDVEPVPIPKRSGLAGFDFDTGTLILTEAGSKRRASLRLVRGADGVADCDPGGMEVLDSTVEAFAERLRAESHTVKRALTDPRIFSGIGNAYSDEILHRAGMSPFRRTGKLDDDEIAQLHRATVETLEEWTARLIDENGTGFPKKVTAFRPEMAVHGRFGEPCPVCGDPVQRLIYASNEANYCPGCQTGGKLLADRGMSRLLKDDWPRTLEELEERRGRLGS